ncbi:MAG: hypothetical protein M3083_00725 [Actinomycetota bacterium]|nr:hypothetical protein [Actinomycetota bacterium]
MTTPRFGGRVETLEGSIQVPTPGREGAGRPFLAETNEFLLRARARSAAWKAGTATLPEAARVGAPYIRDGRPQGLYDYCLPAEFADYNLLAGGRGPALGYFARESIAWHQPTASGPTNHLLSSQVQCVNALEPMSTKPALLVAAFEKALDVVEPLEVDPGRFVAFEYIGQRDYLGEVGSGRRVRGSMTTSADAAIRYRNSDGSIEIALIEWKYCEDYRGLELSAGRHGNRQDRYRALWKAADCPVRTDLIPYGDLFVEPFYQLFRQQLLAHEMEKAHEGAAAAVRVLHVSPATSSALRSSLNRDSHRDAGCDVFAIWRAMVRDSERFVTLDAAALCDSTITGPDYVDRYGHQ